LAYYDYTDLFTAGLARRVMEVFFRFLWFCLGYILWGERWSCIDTLIVSTITVLVLLFGLTAREEEEDGIKQQMKEIEPPVQHRPTVCLSLKPPPTVIFSNVFSTHMYRHVIYSHYPERYSCYCRANHQ